MTTDKTHETSKLKRSIQTTCLMTYSGRAFIRQYTKVFIQTYAWQSHYTWRDCGKNVRAYAI